MFRRTVGQWQGFHATCGKPSRVRSSEQIRRYRRRAGLSQQQLATRAGISTTTVSHAETEANQPTVATLRAIAKALRVPVASLLDD